MGKISYVTEEGLKRLKDELEHMEKVERPSISKQIAEARDKGDLSENADYHKAKEDQAFLEGKIKEYEEILSGVVIIKEKHSGLIDVGSTVTIQEEGQAEEKYQLVGAKEANPRDGHISNESPIGRALLGHRVGDEVAVDTPNGQTKFKILNIA